LVFSAVDMETTEIPVTSQNFINASLKSTNRSLQEVVVVGYGTQKRKDITGSVGTIKGDALSNVAVPSVDKSFEGRVTGVQASTPSGLLGQAARIRIRGTNSISNSSDPLYVVDGVPYISGNQGSATQYNPISDINPNDIETIEVLKDGAATAIYGSRAANGVILVTTKRGKLGKAKVSYNDWFASAKASKRFDLLNATDFVTVANEKFKNIGNNNNYAVIDPTGINTDWQDQVLRTAFQQNHNLSLSGATDQTNYFVSMGYAKMQGMIVANDLTKYNFRAKLEQKALNNHLTIGTNVSVAYNINNGLNTGTNALSGNVGGAIRAFPNVGPKNADGTYNFSADNARLGKGANTREIDDNYTNIAYVLANNKFRSQGMNLTGNAFARIKIIEGLNIGTQIGINYINTEDFWYYNPIHGDGKSSNGIVEQAFSPTFRYNWQNTIDYSKTFGEHQLNIFAAQELQKTRSRFVDGNGTNLSNVFFGTNGNIISNTLANQFYSGGLSERSYMSYLAKANYSFMDRYLISVSVRNDKISSLPWGKQDATLPGASVGWRISKESFFQGVSFINDLKIRGGYAEVGNVEIGNFPYAGTFGPVQYGDWSGVQYNRLGNPNLRFETSKKANIGLDATLFDSRLQITADYFKNTVDNIILAAPTPPSLGVPGNSIATNIGSMYNKGWELSLNTINIRKKDFTWSTMLNFSSIKNQVTKLANNNSDIINTYNITRVGQSIGSFFGYEYAGVNPSNGNPLWVKADGSIAQGDFMASKYYAYDPKNPGVLGAAVPALTAADKKILGQANPTWFGGLGNTLTYKNFDFNIFLAFSGGNKVYNVTRQESLNNQKFMNGGQELFNRWTTQGQVTSVPKLYYASDNFINQNGSLNSRFLENGDFLRAQNIALGYTVPADVLSRIKVSSLRLYAQIQNAFIITKYSGLDPELGTSVTTNNAPGIDYNVSPLPRTITVGLNLSF
jgi:TonB-dependent starch-binding outer membrane protein SusC